MGRYAKIEAALRDLIEDCTCGMGTMSPRGFVLDAARDALALPPDEDAARAEADALRRELAEAREGLRAVMQADAEEADDYLDLGARFAEVAKERDALRALVQEWVEAHDHPMGGDCSLCRTARALLADKEGM